MSTTCFHVCIPSTLWRHPSGLPLSGFGPLFSRAPPFGANTCRGSFSWASRASQDDQTTPNVHFWAAKLQTRTVEPQFHEDASERRKTDERVWEKKKRAKLVPPLLCTTLRLGATGLGLGLSLSSGLLPLQKNGGVSFSADSCVCRHDGNTLIAPQCMIHMHDASSNANLTRDCWLWHKVKARGENAWEMENRQECGYPRVWGLTVVPVPSASLLPNTSLWVPPCAGVPANDADTAHGVQVFSMCTVS